jgi:hypothetical protein
VLRYLERQMEVEEVEEVEGAGSEQDEDEDGNEDAMEDRGYHDSCSSVMRNEVEGLRQRQQQHIPQTLKNTKKKMSKQRLMDPPSISINKRTKTLTTYALQTRISVVKISVEVVAQRLMEAVQGGWVVELWRGVGVVVDLVEGCEQGEEGEEEEWL